MSNEILNSILKEYDKNKLNAELDLEKRKEDLYKKIPRFLEIENELNSNSICVAKNILNGNSSELKDLYKNIDNLKTERANLLKKNNIDDDFFKPHYSCNFCNDTGYIMQDNSQTVMCNCLKQKLLDFSYNISNLSNLEKENFSTFNEKLFSNEIDSSKYNMDVSPRNNILSIKDSCIDFVNNFDNPNSKNLLFTGNTGLR